MGRARLPHQRAGSQLRDRAGDRAGQLTARLGCSVRVAEPHTILSWALAVDGRKHEAAGALFDSAGRLLCASQALWIELRQE